MTKSKTIIRMEKESIFGVEYIYFQGKSLTSIAACASTFLYNDSYVLGFFIVFDIFYSFFYII